MRKFIRTLLALAIFLVPAFGLVYWWETPRLDAVSPAPGAAGQPAAASLRLTFSRRMQPSTLTSLLSTDPASQGTYTWQGNTLVFMPSKPWPAGASVKVSLAAGGKADNFFHLGLSQGRTWTFTIGQPRLAYLYPSSGPADIYTIYPSSPEAARLTNVAGGVQDFQVNASGTAIYYSVRNESQSDSAIYRLDLAPPELSAPPKETAQPSEPVLVLSCPQASCGNLAVSQDGKYLAYERTPLPGAGEATIPQVWILPLPASNTSEAIPKPAGNPIHQTILPAWSTTDLLVFYDKNDQAFIMVDPEGAERARFTNSTGQNGAWNPDGKAYVSPEIITPNVSATLTGLPSVSSSHLMVYDWQKNASQDLTPGAEFEDAEPAYSLDGATLVFARKYLDPQHWSPGRQIWLKRMDTGEAHQLTNDPDYNHFDFAWSPTGDQLAFMRFNQTAQTEPPEIWLINLATGQSVRLITGGYLPQWIP